MEGAVGQRTLGGVGGLVGCDQPVSHNESKSTNPITGTTTTKDQTTYQKPDGSTYTDYSKSKSTGEYNSGTTTH